MAQADPLVPIWIHAPIGRDGFLIKSALAGRRDPVRVAREIADLRHAAREADQIGVLVITQEGFSKTAFEVIEDYVSRQPRWAELPLILLVDRPGNTMTALGDLQDALPRTKILVLQRPLRPSAIESAVDIMRQSRLRQYALRDYIERQEVLRRELNHRVKNILATVQALYGLTFRAADDLAAFDQLFQGRLRAMASVHEILHADSYAGTDAGAAVSSVLQPYVEAGRIEVATQNPPRLLPEAAQSLALMVHELATNAAKYGALSGEGGTVRLRLGTEADELRIAWAESDGPPVAPPAREGYGTTFLRATARSFGGHVALDFAESGFKADIALPLRSIQRPPS